MTPPPAHGGAERSSAPLRGSPAEGETLTNPDATLVASWLDARDHPRMGDKP